jgi:hypothetical protein
LESDTALDAMFETGCLEIKTYLSEPLVHGVRIADLPR